MAQSYKILALFPHPGKSHVDVFLPLTHTLAERGHQVTVVSHFPSTVRDNLTDILLDCAEPPKFDFDSLQKKGPGNWLKFAQDTCRHAYRSTNLQVFLRENQSFDVILAEFFISDCFLGVVSRFRAPLIGLSSSSIIHWTNERFGNPTHPAYIPNNIMTYSDRLSFWERVENTMIGLLYGNIFAEAMMTLDESIAQEFLGIRLNLREIVFNSSLLLVNTHFSLSLPRPLVPNVIEVGGIHIQNVKLLPNVSYV